MVRLSIDTPPRAVTVGGVADVFTEMPVRFSVVLRRTTFAAFAPSGRTSGDQLCEKPLARSLYPFW